MFQNYCFYRDMGILSTQTKNKKYREHLLSALILPIRIVFDNFPNKKL